MNHSPVSVLTSRQDAIQLLSRQRGRLHHRPLHQSSISKWCADLGFEAGLKEYDEDQMEQLRAINLHYATGGKRKELLIKMRNPQWYRLQS